MKGSFKQKLIQYLKDKLDERELKLLPRGYQQLGHIVILNLQKELYPKKMIIAEAVKNIVVNCKTVCLKTGEIKGKYREPQLELLIGNDTEVIVVENNIKYKFDVMKIMFAKGNINERKRYINLIKEGEIVFDFFAGIGYFSLGIAKFSKAKKVYSFEINPVAYNYLLENIKLNKIPHDKIIPIFGDCNIEAPKLGIKADRILMGILPSPKSSLDTAFKVLNDKFGVIHYEGILKINDTPEILFNEVKLVADKYNRKIDLVHIERIKSYGPKIDHICLDINVY